LRLRGGRGAVANISTALTELDALLVVKKGRFMARIIADTASA
jgi:hypothetical protein